MGVEFDDWAYWHFFTVTGNISSSRLSDESLTQTGLSYSGFQAVFTERYLTMNCPNLSRKRVLTSRCVAMDYYVMSYNNVMLVRL